MLARWLGLPRQGGHEEAVLLFTSGSSGEPKGVVLSHHNVIGNVTQFTVMLDARPEDSLLASLPFFHSFGCTVTLWYPLIEGTPIVTYPNPLEAAEECCAGREIAHYRSAGDADFLARVFAKKPSNNNCVRHGWSSLARRRCRWISSEKFFERFGKRVMEGYGLNGNFAGCFRKSSKSDSGATGC